MKPAAEWDLNYIKQLPLGELDWVEFKGRKSLDFSAPSADAGKVTDELSKQLSAFANSGGGVLVYGINNPTNNTARAVDDGGIAFTCKAPNIREWLEDVIPNLVEFPLKKFNVYALTSTAGAPELAPDRCVVLVDIPDSSDVPHQSTRELRYYARGKSRPIGHRLVADMFHRERHARFDVLMAFKAEIKTLVPVIRIGSNKDEGKQVRCVNLIIGAANKGKRMAQYMRLIVWLPEDILPQQDRDEDSLQEMGGQQYYIREFNNTRQDVMKIDPMFGAVTQRGPSWFDPVLPGLTRHWDIECRANVQGQQMPPDKKVMWELYCDNAPPISGQKLLNDIPFDGPRRA